MRAYKGLVIKEQKQNWNMIICSDLDRDCKNETICHELIHIGVHYDKGNLIGNSNPEYEEVAERAGKIVLNIFEYFVRKDRIMNDLKIFNNSEFGQIRTVEIEGKVYFVGKDVANALGYSNPRDAIARHCKGVVKHDSFKDGGQEVALIPEGDMYRLITHSKLESAERFESWVFDEVLPSIRQTGQYQQKPLTQLEILQQSVEVLNRHDKEIKQIDTRMDKLEFDIPLYGSEADELSNHVKRKGVAVLGGKQSEAYKDTEIRSKVYRDIYDQIKREFGIYDDTGRPKSYKALKRKYIADAHEFIDCYEAPMYLMELIDGVNAQMDLGVA